MAQNNNKESNFVSAVVCLHDAGRAAADFFAALDGVYRAADYLWPGLNILLPAALLLLWWGILALVRWKKERTLT